MDGAEASVQFEVMTGLGAACLEAVPRMGWGVMGVVG